MPAPLPPFLPGLFKERVQLVGRSGTRIVGIGADQLSVHMLRPYTEWEEFLPNILQALDAYRETANPKGVRTLALGTSIPSPSPVTTIQTSISPYH